MGLKVGDIVIYTDNIFGEGSEEIEVKKVYVGNRYDGRKKGEKHDSPHQIMFSDDMDTSYKLIRDGKTYKASEIIKDDGEIDADIDYNSSTHKKEVEQFLSKLRDFNEKCSNTIRFENNDFTLFPDNADKAFELIRDLIDFTLKTNFIKNKALRFSVNHCLNMLLGLAFSYSLDSQIEDKSKRRINAEKFLFDMDNLLYIYGFLSDRLTDEGKRVGVGLMEIVNANSGNVPVTVIYQNYLQNRSKEPYLSRMIYPFGSEGPQSVLVPFMYHKIGLEIQYPFGEYEIIDLDDLPCESLYYYVVANGGKIRLEKGGYPFDEIRLPIE